MFTNPFRPSQLAENTKRILNEIVAWTLKTDQTHNAALSGEQRDHPTLNLATFSTEADLG
ncbi:hypothetical protein G6Z96_19940 [Vibrio aestuarianus subsp. cardii]|nr:hypothetical protein [Vibrio aestuarianus subsp. cardii]